MKMSDPKNVAFLHMVLKEHWKRAALFFFLNWKRVKGGAFYSLVHLCFQLPVLPFHPHTLLKEKFYIFLLVYDSCSSLLFCHPTVQLPWHNLIYFSTCLSLPSCPCYSGTIL